MAKDAEHARIIVRCQHDRAAVDHARFLAGDLADGRAEELGVVEADRSDDGGERADHIRRVEAPAHSHLEHHHLALRIGERDEREERQSFEIRREDAGAIGGGAEFLDCVAQLLRRDHRSADRPALAQLHQMR
jgi:hypothetical protein